MESGQVVEAGDTFWCEVAEEIIRFFASGLRNIKRLGTLYPTMWRDVCLRDRNAKLEVLGPLLRGLGLSRARDGQKHF